MTEFYKHMNVLENKRKKDENLSEKLSVIRKEHNLNIKKYGKCENCLHRYEA